MRHGMRWGGAALLVAALAVGCTRGPTGTKAQSDEDQVRAQFVALQDALKEMLAKPDVGDTLKIWILLAKESQDDADRIAKTVSAKYEKADAAAQAKMAAALHVAADNMGSYSGKQYLRSKEFLGKHDEISESKVTKIVVQNDQATVHYIEPDGDDKTQKLVREGGQWSISLAIPRFEMKQP